MGMQASSVPTRLRRSRHLSWFAHFGAVYLFHDLYGYLMEMSPDIAAMIESFGDGVDTQETIEYYKGKFEDGRKRWLGSAAQADTTTTEGTTTEADDNG